MIVAGIGCRKGVSPSDVLAAVDAALKGYALERQQLTMLATASHKRDETGIIAASAMLSLPLVLVDEKALEDMSPYTLTNSAASQQAVGTPSVSEAAALAAAGEGARLAGPRIATGNVTCAIAYGSAQ